MESLKLLYRTGMMLACIVFFLWATCCAHAFQATAPAPPTLEERIAGDLEVINAAARTEIDARSLGRLWAHLALDYEDAAEFAKAEEAYNRSLQILEHAPDSAKDFATALENLGSLYLAMHNDDEAERCRKRAQVAFEKIGDAAEIAMGKALLAEAYLGEHKFKEAQKASAEAYAAMAALKDADSGQIVSALITLTFASCMRGQCAYALERAREAKLRAMAAFPADSLLVAETRSALGYAEWKTGMNDAADEEMRESIRILRERTTPGHPYLRGVLAQYHAYLKDTHRTAEADEIAREEQALGGATPSVCANCTVSTYSLRGH